MLRTPTPMEMVLRMDTKMGMLTTCRIKMNRQLEPIHRTRIAMETVCGMIPMSVLTIQLTGVLVMMIKMAF